MRDLDEVFDALDKSAFRRRQQLSARDAQYLSDKGLDTVMLHARDFIAQRLAPAQPRNDGKQTPMRGHPVFVAQHATACCCRGCLSKWHGIQRGHELTEQEQAHVLAALERWLRAR
jgi:CHAD domain-containing protein